MCSLKFSRSSRVTPSIFNDLSREIVWPQISMSKSSTLRLDNKILWDLSAFVVVCFLLNYSTALAESVSRCRWSTHTHTLSLSLRRWLSSAWLTKDPWVGQKNKSLIKMLNSKGPSTEPWGTPLFISVQSLNAPINLTLCNRFLR